jgi:hypothetical protein
MTKPTGKDRVDAFEELLNAAKGVICTNELGVGYGYEYDALKKAVEKIEGHPWYRSRPAQMRKIRQWLDENIVTDKNGRWDIRADASPWP